MSPHASPSGKRTTSTARSAEPAPAEPNTSSTTVPPTPTAPSTSATRSTSASRISSSKPRPWPASMPPTSPAGTATASPSRSRSTKSSAAKSSKCPPSPSAAPAASTPRNTSTSSAPSSSASASSAAGPTLPHHVQRVRVQDRRGLLRLLREWLRLQGPQTRLLVHPRPHRPRRGRGRVRDAHLPLHLRPLPAHLRPRRIDPALAGTSVYTIIWTTTPWTLPASLAVAFNPELPYVALRNTDGNVYIVAEALAEHTRVACSLPDTTSLATFPGTRLDRATFQHPFLDRSSSASTPTTSPPSRAPAPSTPRPRTAPTTSSPAPATASPSSATSTPRAASATACPSTTASRSSPPTPPSSISSATAAPSWAGRTSTTPTRTAGAATTPSSSAPPSSGSSPWKPPCPPASPSSRRGRTRHHLPSARPRRDPQRHLGPGWGEERISNMIARAPTGASPASASGASPSPSFSAKVPHAAQRPGRQPEHRRPLQREGADAWYAHDVPDLLPAGTACPIAAPSTTSARRWTSSTSGLSPAPPGTPSSTPTPTPPPAQQIPADLYTEGGDQHRGWFHSSLLTSVAVRGHAPYKMVATSGWTLDEQGRAFSKSLGNGVDPVDVANRLGAEVIRLWVASVDFREDVAASENLMGRVSDNYRKLRNTLRFLLGNLHDFDPATNAVTTSQSSSLSTSTSSPAPPSSTPKSAGPTTPSSSTAPTTPSTSS